MNENLSHGLRLVVWLGLIGCAGDPITPSAPAGNAAPAPIGSVGSPTGVGGQVAAVAGGGGMAVGSAGAPPVVPVSGGGAGTIAPPIGGGVAGSTTTQAGGGGSGGVAGTAPIGGIGGGAGSGGLAGAGGSAAASGNDLTGTLGALGAVKPILAGWATTNGLETLIYLSSSQLTCAQMMTRGVKWLASLPAGTQIIEIVVRGTAMVGTIPVGVLQGEVNYAEGSKSSSTEVVGSGGSIMFTKADAKKVFEGTVTATFPKGNLMGKFHADWCEGGTEY